MTLAFQIGYNQPLQFLLVTIFADGGLALLIGYLLGKSKSTIWLAFVAAVILAAGIACLRKTILDNPMIHFAPIFGASEDLFANPGKAIWAIFWFLRGWIITFLYLRVDAR